MALFKKGVNSSLIISGLLLVGISLSAQACQSTSKKVPVNKPAPTKKFTACKDPRPEICTQQYDPVCATKDTGIRCVTTPCPSTEKVTYSNACAACADPKVHGYSMGACE